MPEHFENLGVPVRKAGLMGCIVGPDATGERRLLYFNFNQIGGKLFLGVVDPESGEVRQYNSPEGPGAWALIEGPDRKIYLGTWDGGYILRFDPQTPDKGIEVVGKPSETESYIWMYTIGHDGKLYGCTYPQAKLVSYDPATGEMADLGRMDESEMYTRSVATGPNGKIYTGIGYGKANIVVYNPATGEHRSILPEPYRVTGGASVMRGRDGNLYAQASGQWFRAEDETLVPIEASDYPGSEPQILADDRILQRFGNGEYALHNPKTGETTKHTFTYEGTGSRIFVVGVGPDDKVYGSTIMPLEMFVYDPVANRSTHLGNPTDVNGELYSLVALHDKLYVCAYPGSWLSIYDPSKPWNYGKAPDSNPRGFGTIGDGHLRPRAMIVGPKDRRYIGSLPPYGELGGAMACYDPSTDRVIENYRNLIPNQSIVSLAYEPESGFIFGGSSIAGGGGSHPTETEAHFFAWDTERKEKVIDLPAVFDTVQAEGQKTVRDTAIVAMTAAKGLVFAVGRPSNTLFVYDVKAREMIHRVMIPYGGVHEISLGLWRDGLIYGLAGNAIFTINPDNFELNRIGEYEGGISCGFAMTETGIYFGSGVHWVRYVMPET